jgi:hypothetical protein
VDQDVVVYLVKLFSYVKLASWQREVALVGMVRATSPMLRRLHGPLIQPYDPSEFAMAVHVALLWADGYA